MHRLLVAKEKSGTRHFTVDDDKALQDAALSLLRERFKEGYWYDGDDARKAGDILTDKDGISAWAFLRARKNHEYESVDLVFTQ